MKTLSPIIISGLVALSACAHESSDDLAVARAEYQRAAQGPASSFAQADLYEAKKALDEAEAVKKRKHGSDLERDLAYVAARRAQHAQAVAQLKVAKEDQREAFAQRTNVLESQRDQSKEQLAATSEKLSEKEKDLADKEAKLAAAEAEQAALKERLEAANAALSKDEKGRMVVTLSGAVLFKSASADLLPTARRRLEEVANVLREYDGASITVEGHTDSRGTENYNSTLSLHRAQSVERFLEGQGIDNKALRSVGRGESEPIASNDNPEGRANNRRVEIVIDEDEEIAQR